MAKQCLHFRGKPPTEPGTYFVQAIGNAVNGNGSADANDSWNWMTPRQIVVEPTNSITDVSANQDMVIVSPLPTSSTATVILPSDASGGAYTVLVTASDGQTVYSEQITLAEQNSYVWNGKSMSGADVANGSIFLLQS